MISTNAIIRNSLATAVVITLTLTSAQYAQSGNLPSSTNKNINALDCKGLLKLRKKVVEKLKTANFELEQARKSERQASGYLNLWNETVPKINAKLKTETDPKKIKILKHDRKEAKDLARGWESNRKNSQRDVNRHEREKLKLDADMKRIRKAGKKNSCGPKVSA